MFDRTSARYNVRSQLAKCGRNLQCACKIQFGKIIDLRACGAFLDEQSAIKVLQVLLQLLNKSGPNYLIFFNDFFSEL